MVADTDVLALLLLEGDVMKGCAFILRISFGSGFVMHNRSLGDASGRPVW